MPQRKPRKINPRSIANLPIQPAIDSPSEEGDLVVIASKIPQWMKDEIRKLPGNQSYHIRQALRSYLATFNQKENID